MNQPFDFNSCEDFVNMSSTAQIRPNRSIEIRNLSGDQVKYICRCINQFYV